MWRVGQETHLADCYSGGNIIAWATTEEGVAMLGLPVLADCVGLLGSTLFSKAMVPSLRHALFLAHRRQGGRVCSIKWLGLA